MNILAANKNAHQSYVGLCRLLSHPLYNAPFGPNWPFKLGAGYIKSEFYHSSLLLMTHNAPPLKEDDVPPRKSRQRQRLWILPERR
jgi:hypothetical protein